MRLLCEAGLSVQSKSEGRRIFTILPVRELVDGFPPVL